MKKIVRNIMGIASILLIGACEDGDKVFDEITSNETRGAILRTVSLNSNELPIGEATANFDVDLEIQDQENGTLVSSVEVFIGFNDNTDAVGPGTDVAEQLFTTINSSEFTTGEFGLPRFNFNVLLNDMLSFVGRNSDDITGGDNFPIRFELVLVDGRRYSNADNSGTLTGSFFSSPFLYSPLVICPVPEDYFVGDYSITQTTGSAPFGIADGFTQSPVTVVANGTNRTIGFSYDPGGFDVAYTFSLDLVCNEIQGFSGTINSGSLGCDGSSIGQTGVGVVPYDLADDSSFTITFEDFNPDGGCGGVYEAIIILDKL